MARFDKKKGFKPEPAPKAVEVVEAPKSEALISNKELTQLKDTKNSERNEKILIIESIEAIQKNKQLAEKALIEITEELNLKNRQVQYLNTEIAAQNSTLKNIKVLIERDREEENAHIKSQMDKIASSDAEYKKLIKDVTEKRDFLESELHKIADERRLYQAESDRLNKAMQESDAHFQADKEDLDQQRAIFFEEKEKFEEMQASLEPELRRISEIKNENANFLARAEALEEGLRGQKESHAKEQEASRAEYDRQLGKLREHENALDAEEKKFQKRLQDLADYELEVKAREAEVSKKEKRDYLLKSIEQNTEKTEE